ncbi:hypothetical protein C4J81_18635 (plasmid) [Deltaproteobacteria bacterium Smac51]|nr:hypothetical protein C4J81_18635 [Deltaproteobacteria bacterium Smac51]
MPMLKGLSRPEALELLSEWEKAILGDSVYGFGLSKNIFVHAPVYRLNDDNFALKGVYDNNETLWGQTVLGCKILPPDTIESGGAAKIVVFNADYQAVKKQLSAKGLKENNDFISVHDFWSLFCFYKYKRLYSGLTQCVVLTDRCNLNCEFCGAKIPTMSNPMGHRPFEAVKDDMALLFNHVDYFEYCAFGVGEPFTYPHLARVLDLVRDRYRRQVGHFFMATNGTITPEACILDKIRECEITVNISDYSVADLPGQAEKVARLSESLSKRSIDFKVVDEPWCESYIGPNDPERAVLSDPGALMEHFRECFNPCTCFFNGLYYPCSYSYTYKATGALSGETDLDGLGFKKLRQEAGDDRLEILMSFLGYHKQGGLKACTLCRGRGTSVPVIPVPKAKQLTGSAEPDGV